MCNTAEATLIIEVLDEKVQNGEVFTAFDITSAARSKTDDNIRHSDVRHIVGNEFSTQQMGNYDRELRTLDLSSSPQAFVYFPDTKTAEDHPLVSAALVTPNPTNLGVSHGTSTFPTPTPTVFLDDDEVKTTAEGRVQIPRKLVAQVTPNGGTYDILIGGTLKCANKDARGDLRIGLKQLGINDPKVRVTVDSVNNTINIETV
jgi:hypothetical protein